jgi:hypothetical protein
MIYYRIPYHLNYHALGPIHKKECGDMWIHTPESRQVITEVSKDVVAEIAPEELELVDELLDDYYANPEVQESKDNPLGFGSEVLAAATPVVAMALQTLFTFILNEVWVSAQKESAILIAQKMKALFNPDKTSSPKGNKAVPALELTREQLEKARQLIKKEAMRGGMKPKKAEELALKIVGRIALTG